MPEEIAIFDSILNSIKKLLGPTPEYEHFDIDLMIHINTFLNNLVQAGIGKRNFIVTDASQTWEDFLGDGHLHFQQAKTYVYIKVRTVFDPPASSFALDAMTKMADELLWRLNVDADPGMEELFRDGE